MIKCDNCPSEAVYTCADPGVNPVNYCALCLPVWLTDRAQAGHFPLKTEEKPVAEKPVEEKPAEKTVKKKAAEAPADENN